MKNRVLIAEDEKPISDIIKFNLEKEGYEIITAYDGEDALKKAFPTLTVNLKPNS